MMQGALRGWHSERKVEENANRGGPLPVAFSLLFTFVTLMIQPLLLNQVVIPQASKQDRSLFKAKQYMKLNEDKGEAENTNLLPFPGLVLL